VNRFQLLITSKNEKVIIEEITNLYWKEGLKMRWHCISCGIYYNELPDLLICPFCNSKRIERISDPFKI
jgi:rubrerythrin